MAKEEVKSNEKSEVKLLITGMVTCLFAFLGILVLPVSIVCLIKAINLPGSSGTKIAAIIFNALSILFEISAIIVVVMLFIFYKVTFSIFPL